MKQTLTLQGFTLIELMVTVAIVGILAGIALPSYQESVSKSRRKDAEGALLGLTNAMERRYTETNSYLGSAGTKDDPEDTGAPWIFTAQSPLDGGTAAYNLTIDSATANSYTLFATPTGAQTGDKCGTLTLTNTGLRGISDELDGIEISDCW